MRHEKLVLNLVQSSSTVKMIIHFKYIEKIVNLAGAVGGWGRGGGEITSEWEG